MTNGRILGRLSAISVNRLVIHLAIILVYSLYLYPVYLHSIVCIYIRYIYHSIYPASYTKLYDICMIAVSGLYDICM